MKLFAILQKIKSLRHRNWILAGIGLLLFLGLMGLQLYSKGELRTTLNLINPFGDADQEAQLSFLRIISGPPSETVFGLAGAISAGISRPPNSSPCDESGICGVPGLIAVAQSSQSPFENIEKLRDNSADSALVPIDVAYHAMRGTQMFKGQKPIHNLRMISPLAPLILQIIVPANSEIKTLRDLKYKNINIGAHNSGLSYLGYLLLKIAGIKAEQMQIFHDDEGAAFDRMLNGEIDAVFGFGAPPLRQLQEIAHTMPIRIIPIDNISLNQLNSLYPHFSKYILPAASYNGMDEAVQTLEIELVWVVKNNLSTNLGEAIAFALWQGNMQKLLQLNHPDLMLRNIEHVRNITLIPYHPGAKRFYVNHGILK